jgi:ubiquitin-protein ligase
MASNKRQIRLEQEWLSLQAINRESDSVQIEQLEMLPGSAPEKYKVTFRCKGIVGIDASKKPIYGTEHAVAVYCHGGFPTDAPFLKWLTPIWHPNIQHAGERNVCINKTEWLGGMMLSDLCQQMLEMVQYKNYHADSSPPYPLDAEAAAWVRDYAERNGIVDKNRGIFVDDVPFYRPGGVEPTLRIKIVGKQPQQATPAPKIRIHGTSTSGDGDRVVLEAGAGPIPCPRCAVNLQAGSSRCGNCGSELATTPRRIRFGD